MLKKQKVVKRKRKKVPTTWFVVPLNDFTNGVMAEELSGQDLEDICDQRNAHHRAFRCTWTLVDKLRQASRFARDKLVYRVYSRKRGESKSKRTPFFEPRPKRKVTNGRNWPEAKLQAKEGPADVF